MSEQDRHIEELFEEYRQQRNTVGELQRAITAISVTAVSARREVSVTVNHAGVVTDLSFPTSAYRRLTPQEFATLLLRTMQEAKEQAMTQAAELLSPLLPAGVRARDLVSGQVDADTFLPPEPRLPQSVFEYLRR